MPERENEKCPHCGGTEVTPTGQLSGNGLKEFVCKCGKKSYVGPVIGGPAWEDFVSGKSKLINPVVQA